MAIKNFRRGLSTFTCRCCHRLTRETGRDHAQTELCEPCFDLAGIENAISDNGDEVIPTYYDEARDLLKKLAKAGADMSNWEGLTSILDTWKENQK